MRGDPSARPGARIIVMGVSGCGKSTLATALAQALGVPMVDGDDLHLPQSVAKMKAGIALDDSDRWPWLDRIGAILAEGTGHVIACSALRRAYRDRIRAACPPVVFVFLDGARSTILERMRQRQGHYMPPALLDSQLSTLERPGADEPDVIHLQVESSPPEQVASGLRGLDRLLADRSGMT